MHNRMRVACLALAVVVCSIPAAWAQPMLEIRDFVVMPMTGLVDGKGNNELLLARVNTLREEVGGAKRLFISDLNGPLYILDKATRTFTTYLDLKAGAYIFGLNVDDGWVCSSSPNARDTLGTLLGFRNGPGGNAGNPLQNPNGAFNVIVPEDGIYPFRILFFEGGGGVNLEFLALDPQTGAQRWRFNPGRPQTPAGAPFSKCRGVVAWTDPTGAADMPCKTRIVFGANLDIFALDSRSGRLCRDFGVNGVVHMKLEKPTAFLDEVQLRSPGALINDTVIFGSTFIEDYRVDQPSGKVRAFDLRTGALRWEYDPIPRDPADPAYATWGNGSAVYEGAANVWSFIAVDPANDLVFLPTSAPSAEYFGGHRPGANKWSTTLVALNASTGKQVWAFQTTHHDIFDYDLPAQPILVDLLKGGRRIPAVVQLTKQGFVFVFNRLTGVPVYPVIETPVPQGTDVPGEWISPTQPYPTVIPQLTPASLRSEEAWGFTPIDRYFCRKQIEKYRSDGLYTPATLQGSIFLPSIAGGANWGGAAVNPKTNLMVVPTMNLPVVLTLVPRGTGGANSMNAIHAEDAMLGTPYSLRVQFLVSPFGAPCSAPPWGKLTAVDLNTGKIRWAVPIGTIENLKPLTPPLMLGSPFSGGPLMTAGGVVFMAGGTDRKFRAFDADTGKILWTARLAAPGMAAPMTYSINGTQYIVLAAGGNNVFPTPIGDTVIAFALER